MDTMDDSSQSTRPVTIEILAEQPHLDSKLLVQVEAHLLYSKPQSGMLDLRNQLLTIKSEVYRFALQRSKVANGGWAIYLSRLGGSNEIHSVEFPSRTSCDVLKLLFLLFLCLRSMQGCVASQNNPELSSQLLLGASPMFSKQWTVDHLPGIMTVLLAVNRPLDCAYIWKLSTSPVGGELLSFCLIERQWPPRTTKEDTESPLTWLRLPLSLQTLDERLHAASPGSFVSLARSLAQSLWSYICAPPFREDGGLPFVLIFRSGEYLECHLSEESAFVVQSSLPSLRTSLRYDIDPADSSEQPFVLSFSPESASTPSSVVEMKLCPKSSFFGRWAASWLAACCCSSDNGGDRLLEPRMPSAASHFFSENEGWTEVESVVISTEHNDQPFGALWRSVPLALRVSNDGDALFVATPFFRFPLGPELLSRLDQWTAAPELNLDSGTSVVRRWRMANYPSLTCWRLACLATSMCSPPAFHLPIIARHHGFQGWRKWDSSTPLFFLMVDASLMVVGLSKGSRLNIITRLLRPFQNASITGLPVFRTHCLPNCLPHIERLISLAGTSLFTLGKSHSVRLSSHLMVAREEHHQSPSLEIISVHRFISTLMSEFDFSIAVTDDGPSSSSSPAITPSPMIV